MLEPVKLVSAGDGLDLIIQNRGSVERKLLQKLNIANVDLEVYGYPKYNACS